MRVGVVSESGSDYREWAGIVEVGGNSGSGRG